MRVRKVYNDGRVVQLLGRSPVDEVEKWGFYVGESAPTGRNYSAPKAPEKKPVYEKPRETKVKSKNPGDAPVRTGRFAKAVGTAALCFLATGIGYMINTDPARVHNKPKQTRSVPYRPQKIYRGSNHQLANDVRKAASSMGRENLSNYLYAMENDIGKERMAGILVAAAPGMPMPDSVEFERYLEVAAMKKGLDPSAMRRRYKDDPEGFARDFYGGRDYSILMNGDIRLMLLGVGINAVREATGQTDLHDHYNTLVEAGGPTGNYIEQFRRANGRDPSSEELRIGRLTNSMTLDSNRAPVKDYSVRRGWSQNGQSGETITYRPFASEAEQRSIQMDARSQQINAERRQQIDRLGNEMGAVGANVVNRAAQDVGQRAQQTGQQINGALQNLFAPKKDSK